MLELGKKMLWIVVLLFVALPAWAEKKANPLDKAPSRFAKLDDIRVHYKSLGEGDTALVFVHGFSGPECKENITKMVDRMLTEQTPAEVRKAIQDGMPTAPQHVAASAMKEMFNPTVWKDEEKIEPPLQVIVAKSPNWPADYE